MNIGIYAGTFDPIHDGHTEFAKSGIEFGHLDKVIIVAEKKPYRKRPYASWDHRQAMIERATEEIIAVDHDYGFAAKLSHQHTMKNMLENAKFHYGADNTFWFLVGSDIFEHIHQWEDIIQKHDYGGFIVALRDNHSKEWLSEQKAKVPEIAHSLIIVHNDNPHISSSLIRAAVKNENTLPHVSSGTATYILSHGLYR